MEGAIIEELLLVCTGMGSSEMVQVERDGEVHTEERFIRGDACEHWMGDLQRALRRDEEHTRYITIILFSWKVMQTKLVPLFLQCRDDSALTMTLAKIFLMLTMPLSGNAVEALTIQVNPKEAEHMQKEQLDKRTNATQQMASLHAAKRCFISKDVMSVLVGMLEDPLSRVGLTRSDSDTETIEVVLTLLRNVLTIPDPTAGATALSCSSSTSSAGDVQMHEELITLMQDELMMDVLLLLAQDISARENTKLNLLLMEIFHAIVVNQDASALLRGQKAHKAGVAIAPAKGLLSGMLSREKETRSSQQACLQSRHSRFGGLLMKVDSTSARGTPQSNSRFIANPFRSPLDSVPQAARKRKVIRTNRKGAAGAGAAPTGIMSSATTVTSAGSSIFVADAARSRASAMALSGSPIAVRAREALFNFSQRFLATSFDPFIRSVKNEFRIDSSRLQAHDKPVFFHMVAYFVSFHRQHQQDLMRAREASLASSAKTVSHPASSLSTSGGGGGGGVENVETTQEDGERAPVATTAVAVGSLAAVGSLTFEVGPILETMDLFSFNLVLNVCQSAMAEKAYGRLEEAVRLLKESMHVLSMLAESPQPAHQLLALGLLGKLFYANEPIDRLHEIMRYWQPGRFSKRFLGDLVELTHVTLKVLELYVKGNKSKDATATGAAAGGSSANGSVVHDKEMEERLEEARDFNFNGYFRRLATNHVMTMYTSALEEFQNNGVKLNHYILTFLRRIQSFQPAKATKSRNGKTRHADLMDLDDEGGGGIGYTELDDNGNPLNEQSDEELFTLEPMLFHVPTLGVFHKILTDPVASKSSEFKPLVRFITDVIRHFAVLASKNNMLYVEALFQHPTPHQACRRFAQVYTSKDDLFYYECLADQRGDGGDDDDDDGDKDGGGADGADGGRGRGGGERSEKGGKDASKEGGGRGRGGGGGDEDDSDDDVRISTRGLNKRKAAAAALDSDDDDVGVGGGGSSSAKKQRGGGGGGGGGDKSPAKNAGGYVDSEDSDDEWDGDLALAAAEAAKAAAKAKAAKKRKKSPTKGSGDGAPKKRSPKWTKEEDDVLKAKYPLYAGTSSVFITLTQEDALEAKERTVEQVTRRLRHLGLLKKGTKTPPVSTSTVSPPTSTASSSTSTTSTGESGGGGRAAVKPVLSAPGMSSDDDDGDDGSSSDDSSSDEDDDEIDKLVKEDKKIRKAEKNEKRMKRAKMMTEVEVAGVKDGGGDSAGGSGSGGAGAGDDATGGGSSGGGSGGSGDTAAVAPAATVAAPVTPTAAVNGGSGGSSGGGGSGGGSGGSSIVKPKKKMLLKKKKGAGGGGKGASSLSSSSLKAAAKPAVDSDDDDIFDL